MIGHTCGIVLCVLATCLGLGEAKVLVISMDGFRWDYINKTSTPSFDRFEANGTRALYINNTFITKTFPCHYSIATGKYVRAPRYRLLFSWIGIYANTSFVPSRIVLFRAVFVICYSCRLVALEIDCIMDYIV